MPGCHAQTRTMTYTRGHTHTHTHTHTRLLSGRQSQRHGVTETKPQKRRLALCDNPLTHIYIQGLECVSVPASPPPHPQPHSAPTSRLRPSILPVFLCLPLGLPPVSPFSFRCLLSPVIFYISAKTLFLVGFICLLSVDSTWPCMAAPID